MSSTMSSSPPLFTLFSIPIEPITLTSLTTVTTLLLAALLARRLCLPAATPPTARLLFTWHAFDALVHLVLEGAFVYHALFSSAPFLPAGGATPSRAIPHPLTPPGVFWLNDPARLYGVRYGEGALAAMWRDYARADRRWEGADLTVVTLEALTVVVGGPMAAGIAVAIARNGGRVGRKTAFWMAVLATGEIYGSWMTFAPEWFTGSPNLDVSNPFFLWCYLFFMNFAWIVFAGYGLYVSYGILTAEPEAKASKKKQ